MDILQTASESVFIPSIGKQADSDKQTMPGYSLGKATRDGGKKVLISNKHNQDLLGRESPGFAYFIKEPGSPEDKEPGRQRYLPKWSFGKAAARPPTKTNKYGEQYNDLVYNIPDPALFKYGTKKGVKIGSLPRGACSNAPDIEGYPRGAISPGPQRYNPAKVTQNVRLGHAPEIDKIQPSYTMRIRTKPMEPQSQTGKKVGPGSYPAPEALGQQATSEKPTGPSWGINRTSRFSDTSKVRDAGRLWDGMKDQKEKNCRAFNSTPSFSFGYSTRDGQKKITRSATAVDKGPAGKMGKPWQSHPELPYRRDVMKYSQVPTSE
eukprot:TRINITY_DN14352_c3_g1_i1.p1 TRINITY_DN14352_c3_g1~~TRINITY_DN14352_c3_g1_i1.p1  ORF type:complete len:321 (-),score=39.81 TRINITY_DN14352_c3_g1_i1:63-1025(-)